MPFKDSEKSKKYFRDYNRIWRLNPINRAKTNIWRRSYAKRNPKIIALGRKRYNVKQRNKVLEYYGNYCHCCGENEIKFLSIDHINGGGTKHRKQIGGGGTSLYLWLIKNNFPIGFQILCYNCNMAKGLYGKCPHNLK